MMGVIGSWLRGIFLFLCLASVFGFAEGVEIPKPTPPQSPNFPIQKKISEEAVLVHVDEGILKNLSKEQKERFLQGIARAAKENFTLELGTMMQPSESRVGDQEISVILPHEVNPIKEKETSIVVYAQQNSRGGRPSARLNSELYEEWRVSATLTIDSVNHPGLKHVTKLRAIWSPLYSGTQQIVADLRRNLQDGLYELTVILPNSIWPQDYSEQAQQSIRQAVANFGREIYAIGSQVVGLDESVPAYSAQDAQAMVEILNKHTLVTEKLENLVHSQLSSNADFDVATAYKTAIAEFEKDWEKKKKDLNVFLPHRTVAPQTREKLLEIGGQVLQRAALTQYLLKNGELQNLAQSTGNDLRLFDQDLMEAVEKRVSSLETAHSQLWEKVAPSIASGIYSRLMSQYTDKVALTQATIEELGQQKQEHFNSLLLKDADLDNCHSRAKGIGKLLVEHGQAIQWVYHKETEYAQSLWNQRASFVADVQDTYPVKKYSEKFLSEELARRFTAAYQAGRDQRYEEIAEELKSKGLINSANILKSTLASLAKTGDLHEAITKGMIPAVALQWNMPALSKEEWTVVNTDGTFHGTDSFQKWVTSQEKKWRVEATRAQMDWAYRTARKALYIDQFWNGPFGVRAWATPFDYLEMVDPKTGEVVLDPTKKRSTWISNLKAMTEYGKSIWNAKGADFMPPTPWRIGCAAASIVTTPSLWALATAGRAIAFGVVTGATAAFGSRFGASAFTAPVAGLLSMDINTGYDFRRPKKEGVEQYNETLALHKKMGWLTAGGIFGGLATGGYIDWSVFSDSSWFELTTTLIKYGTVGFFGGGGLAVFSQFSKERGFFRLPEQIVAGTISATERLLASAANVPLQAANTIGLSWGMGTGVAAAKWTSNFAIRRVLMQGILDGLFVFLGGKGIRVPKENNLLTFEAKGPGISAQNFRKMTPDLALACLFALFEKIDLDNWSERREHESKLPRRNFEQTTGVDQLALSGELTVKGSPVGSVIQEFEKTEAKLRDKTLKEHLKELEPLFNVMSNVQGKLRFAQKNLDTLRASAAAFLERLFTELAHPETTQGQKDRLWSTRELVPGNWAGLADKMLEEAFGEGVLQSTEELDAASYSEVQSPGITNILSQVLRGKDLDVSDRVTVTVPKAVTRAKAKIPFIGAREICSSELLKQAPVLPWSR